MVMNTVCKYMRNKMLTKKLLLLCFGHCRIEGASGVVATSILYQL